MHPALVWQWFFPHENWNGCIVQFLFIARADQGGFSAAMIQYNFFLRIQQDRSLPDAVVIGIRVVFRRISTPCQSFFTR